MNTGRGIGQDSLSIPEKLRLISWPLLLLVTLTACVGFASLYSAAGGHMAPWASKQAVRFIFGLCGLVAVALIDIRFWMKMSYPLYALGILLLVYVDIRGHIGMGAQRWISLGFLELQPSEVVKITTVMALARCFHAATPEDVKNPVFLLWPLFLVALPAGLVAIQPDLGTALTIAIVAGGIFFLAGVPYWMFGTVIALGLAALPVLWHFMHGYQKKRILVFMHPELDPLGAGYHIMQSKIALGSGGFSGQGFLRGTQNQLNFLPEKQTDFVFTILAEEFGFVGSVGVLGLLFGVVAIALYTALRCNHAYGRLVALGIGTNFFLYCAVNLSMVMGLIPVGGVPLPLISYGGSALTAVMLGFGVLMSVQVHRDVEFAVDEA